MKTAAAVPALAAVLLIAATPSNADATLQLSVGNPDTMPVEIRGNVGRPDTREAEITLGNPELANPEISNPELSPTVGLHILVAPPSPCTVADSPCGR